jgi:hypothetical protein
MCVCACDDDESSDGPQDDQAEVHAFPAYHIGVFVEGPIGSTMEDLEYILHCGYKQKPEENVICDEQEDILIPTLTQALATPQLGGEKEAEEQCQGHGEDEEEGCKHRPLRHTQP